MIVLRGFPKNKDKFVRLMDFFGEVLDICRGLDIHPIVDGSLAVFAHTGDPEMDVNDVDTSIPEAEFPRMMKTLDERGISYKLREWHVLQVLKDDLKVELGSREFWLKDSPMDLESLRIAGREVKVLSLNGLKQFYWQAMEDRARGQKENDKIKYERLKVKLDALNDLTS